MSTIPEWTTVSDALLKTGLRTEFLGCTAAEAAWDTTYGSMADGSGATE